MQFTNGVRNWAWFANPIKRYFHVRLRKGLYGFANFWIHFVFLNTITFVVFVYIIRILVTLAFIYCTCFSIKSKLEVIKSAYCAPRFLKSSPYNKSWCIFVTNTFIQWFKVLFAKIGKVLLLTIQSRNTYNTLPTWVPTYSTCQKSTVNYSWYSD